MWIDITFIPWNSKRYAHFKNEESHPLRFDNRDKTFNWYFNQKEVNLASDKHSSANQEKYNVI